jgi:hypothetical protein
VGHEEAAPGCALVAADYDRYQASTRSFPTSSVGCKRADMMPLNEVLRIFRGSIYPMLWGTYLKSGSSNTSTANFWWARAGPAAIRKRPIPQLRV